MTHSQQRCPDVGNYGSSFCQSDRYTESLSPYYSALYRGQSSCSYNYSLPYQNYSLPYHSSVPSSSCRYSDYSAAYTYRDYCSPTYINSSNIISTNITSPNITSPNITSPNINSSNNISPNITPLNFTSPNIYTPTYINNTPPTTFASPATVIPSPRPSTPVTCLDFDKLFADVDLFKVNSLLNDPLTHVDPQTTRTAAPRRAAKRPRSSDDQMPTTTASKRPRSSDVSATAPSKRRHHQCAVCGKSFAHLATLETHQRTHTGEKPYSCCHCGRAFADRSSRNKHERTHTGARPYRCATCGDAFTQSGNLKRHIRRAHQVAQ